MTWLWRSSLSHLGLSHLGLPHLHLRHLGRLAQSGAAILGLLSIALVWVSVIHSMSVERTQALRGAVQSTGNLARAFEEHVVRSVKQADQALLAMRKSYQGDPDHFDIPTWRQRTLALSDFTFQVSLADRHGLLRASNLASTGSTIDLSDREHFRVQLDPAQDALFVSKPVLGRASNKWSIQLTRKVFAENGSFDGVIVMSLDPEYFTRFYRSVDLGGAGVVLLSGTDGVVRASGSAAGVSAQASGQPPAAIGSQHIAARLSAASAQALAGSFSMPSLGSEPARLYSYRGVTGFPLIVAVGIGETELLQPYDASRHMYVAIGILLTAVLMAVTVLVLVRQGRLARAREALRQSEARTAHKSHLLETALEHMSQGIVMIDADHRVQVINRQALLKLGLPADLMTTRPKFSEVLRWQWQHGEFGDDGGDLDAASRQFVLSGGVSDQPHCYERRRSNGTTLEIRSAPLPGGGIVRTYSDVTQRLENEAVLRAARDEADRAAQAKSEFLATMSHEIRSPMSGLLGVLDLLRATRLSEDQHRMADMVHNSAASLLDVLNDILDFSKIEAGALQTAIVPTRLRDFVSDLTQPHVHAAAAKGVELHLHLDTALPGLVDTDPLRLRQILNNLLSNAVKFTAHGSIALSVTCAPGNAGEQLVFAVQDTGLGMGPEVIERLFEPFMQADRSTSRTYGGTGLGLCISRRLTHLLGGQITVTSTPAAGSCFTVTLPLIAASAAVPERAGVDPTQTAVCSAGKHILVADDEPTNRWLTRRQLELLGFAVTVAEHGEAALEQLRGASFDLLVTDCHMPGMDGAGLTTAIRASQPPLCDLPIVGLTADVTPAQLERCRRAGMNEVAIKPLTLAQLSRVLASYFDVPTMPQPALAPPGEACEPDFDPTLYRELFDPADPDGAAWLGEFRETATSQQADLALLLQAAEPDRVAIATAAHRLAGAAFSVGATRLAIAGRSVETAAQNGDPAGLQNAFQILCAAGLGAESALQRFTAGRDVFERIPTRLEVDT